MTILKGNSHNFFSDVMAITYIKYVEEVSEIIKAIKETESKFESVELTELCKNVIIIKIEPVLRVVRCLK